MQYPNKFISHSDFASTPAPLQGAKKIDLTTPANVSVTPLETKEFRNYVTFDQPFDTVEYILTCDEYGDLIVYNGSISEYDDLDIFVSIDIQGNTVSLVAVFTNFIAGTMAEERHYHAVVTPIKSPYQQS